MVKAKDRDTSYRKRHLSFRDPKRSPRPPDTGSSKSLFKRWSNLFKWWKSLSPSRDTIKTLLTTLHQSADAFPLLKSVFGNVLAIWDIVKRIKTCRKRARALAMRCVELLQVIKSSVSDPSALSSEMRKSVVKFNNLLLEIIKTLEQIQKEKWYTRLDKLNRNEAVLRTLYRRVEEHHRDFNTIVSLQNHRTVQEIAKTSKLVQKQVETLDAKFDRILGRFMFPIAVGVPMRGTIPNGRTHDQKVHKVETYTPRHRRNPGTGGNVVNEGRPRNASRILRKSRDIYEYGGEKHTGNTADRKRLGK